MHGEEVLVPLMFLMAAAIVFILYLTTRHRERMSMIEKGLGSEEIKALYSRDRRHNPLNSLKWGILFVLGGVAVMLGNFLHDTYYVNGGVIVGMVCLFVGIGLVAFYSIASKKLGQQ